MYEYEHSNALGFKHGREMNAMMLCILSIAPMWWYWHCGCCNVMHPSLSFRGLMVTAPARCDKILCGGVGKGREDQRLVATSRHQIISSTLFVSANICEKYRRLLARLSRSSSFETFSKMKGVLTFFHHHPLCLFLTLIGQTADLSAQSTSYILRKAN